jgi:hypothetical protein
VKMMKEWVAGPALVTDCTRTGYYYMAYTGTEWAGETGGGRMADADWPSCLLKERRGDEKGEKSARDRRLRGRRYISNQDASIYLATAFMNP